MTPTAAAARSGAVSITDASNFNGAVQIWEATAAAARSGQAGTAEQEIGGCRDPGELPHAGCHLWAVGGEHRLQGPQQQQLQPQEECVRVQHCVIRLHPTGKAFGLRSWSSAAFLPQPSGHGMVCFAAPWPAPSTGPLLTQPLFPFEPGFLLGRNVATLCYTLLQAGRQANV